MLFETTVGAAPDDFAFSGPLTMVLERGPERGRIVTGHTSTPSPPGAGRPPGPDREQP